MTMAAATFRTTGRRLFLGSTGGITAYAVYQAKYDPPHLVWDLDATLLCSVTPLTSGTATPPLPGFSSKEDQWFDQIDDDFPFEEGVPNTRTYWRPGVRSLLQVLRVFTVQHVFTAAQESYTENILQQMDRSLFATIVHRDLVPQPSGKDLVETILRYNHNNNHTTTASEALLQRCILLDDRTRNFTPQQGQNGVHVVPFDVTAFTDPSRAGSSPLVANYRELARWTAIAALALLVPDVRTILPFFQSPDHQQRFRRDADR